LNLNSSHTTPHLQVTSLLNAAGVINAVVRKFVSLTA
jgi:hypothetical protein